MSVNIPNGTALEALIFTIKSSAQFEAAAIEVFRFQWSYNSLYRNYCNYLGIRLDMVNNITDIPFLPISFFKTEKVATTIFQPQVVFESSGTTGSINSKHFVKKTALYQQSFTTAFEQVYGSLKDYAILGLLPSYLERTNASLVFMVDAWMRQSGHSLNSFYLNDYNKLNNHLQLLQQSGQKTLIIGVTYALLDFATLFPQPLSHTIVMETGGMKGRQKEQTREEVHEQLSKAFELQQVHSEYGMTELLSQAYALAGGRFKSPPWMKVCLRGEDDPLMIVCTTTNTVTGIINVIDLANIWSCSFIATDDVGRLYADDTFEVLGRVDHSDVRGCSLMAV